MKLRDEETLTTKPGLEKEWAETVEKNQDPYGHAAILYTARFGKELDAGQTPEAADHLAVKNLGLTGALANAGIQMLVHFHPRGEEVKVWWNKYWGGKGDEKGVINPSIMTIG